MVVILVTLYQVLGFAQKWVVVEEKNLTNVYDMQKIKRKKTKIKKEVFCSLALNWTR